MRRHAFVQRVTWQNVHLSNSQKSSLSSMWQWKLVFRACECARLDAGYGGIGVKLTGRRGENTKDIRKRKGTTKETKGRIWCRGGVRYLVPKKRHGQLLFGFLLCCYTKPSPLALRRGAYFQHQWGIAKTRYFFFTVVFLMFGRC